MSGPLAGVRVLDLTRVLAGPFCSMLLADLGAEIIKLEHPERGDDARAFGPFVADQSVYFQSLNRGKLGITLDLGHPKGRGVFHRLLDEVDILLENFRPGTMKRWGLDYHELSDRHPQLIYAACSGFGQTGPYAQKPAYDLIVQAMGGLMSITGPAGGPPTRVGASVGDITAALFTTVGILSALYERTGSEKGQLVDVAMLDSQVAILENAIARYDATGEVPVPLGNRHPSITPFSSFPTQDGQLVIAIGNDALWKRFCHQVGHPQLASDRRFITNQERTENWDELEASLSQVLAQATTAHWLERLEEAGIPCGPVKDVSEVVCDAQVRSRDMLVHTEEGCAMAGLPIKLSRTPGHIRGSAPALGQHNQAIWGELVGLSAEELSWLQRDGII